MKRLIILMSFGLILLTGCSKEESKNLEIEQSADSFYILEQRNGVPTWGAMDAYLPQQNVSTTGVVNSKNSAHAHGNYTGFGGALTIRFSGTENNGGAHGSAEVRFTAASFEEHYIVETTSMVVNGNEGIYGGIITEVLTNTFPPIPCTTPPYCPPCEPTTIGAHVYFKVFDNGQGNNAPLDQYQGLFQICSALPDGGVSLPWYLYGPPLNVENSKDKIKVN